MKKSPLLTLVCVIISSLVAMADTPVVSIEDWQIGVVNGSEGTLGISTANDDPQFTEPIVSITQEGKVGIGTLYPQPERSWLDYEILRNAVSPSLLCFCNRLQQMQLSEKEITLCVYTLLYDKATLKQLADCLCYSSGSIRTAKRRVAKKLGLDNASALYPFLLKLAIIGTPIWH